MGVHCVQKAKIEIRGAGRDEPQHAWGASSHKGVGYVYAAFKEQGVPHCVQELKQTGHQLESVLSCGEGRVNKGAREGGRGGAVCWCACQHVE